MAVALATTAAHGAPAARFHATANPLRYAREYRDPLWGGTYLRARWYDPALPAFTSRDAAAELVNHYGYGGGNPLMNVDPSGLRYASFGRRVGDVYRTVNRGIGGDLSRIFMGPALSLMQLLAQPSAFWHAVRHDTQGVDIFLAAGAVVTAASAIAPAIRTLRGIPGLGRDVFAGRAALEAAIGTGQSLASSVDDHGRHFSGAAFAQGLEYTFGGELTYRIAAGIGYQPFNLATSDVRDLVATRLGSSYDRVLVFRAQIADLGPGAFRRTWTTPLLEAGGMGLYHERLIGVGPGDFIHVAGYDPVGLHMVDGFGQLAEGWYGRKLRFEYLGVRSAARTEMHFQYDNPLNLPAQRDAVLAQMGVHVPARNAPGWFSNNCHAHVTALRQRLGL